MNGSSAATKQDASKSTKQAAPTVVEDDIPEDIVQDHEDIELQSMSARDPIAASGGASSAVGIDQSIDTLRMDEFDYMEDVQHTPRTDNNNNYR